MHSFKIGDLKVKLPIIQGGMGVGVSLSGLAAAVANEGGIGVISAAAIGMHEPDYVKNFHEANKRGLRKEIRKAKSLSRGVIGLNVMMALTDHEELIRVAIEEKIDVIFIGAGLPLKIPAIIADAGLSGHHTKLVPKVSSAKAAGLIFRYWASRYNFVPDAVVVEGPMAGGHLGFKKDQVGENRVTIRFLVEETVNTIRPFETTFNKEIPVIAGGGLQTGKDIYDIMQAGAKGVKIGTRFVTTHECDADIEYKKAYLSAKKEDIVIIDSPVGLPGRVVKNKFVEQIMNGEAKPFKCPWKCLSTCNYKEAPFCIAKALFNSAKGKMEEGFAFAGANAYMADKIVSVAEVINELVTAHDHEVLLHKISAIRPMRFHSSKAISL
ncbi:MAG: nitronate monooxygenase family protein [Bacteroidales bacterium]|nr:nitronate monooxygenase family protein [Bacteroidales bacterium]MCF8403240.1 nitronate monooxygenase family protein [Bacteroidales bacterium]